MNIDRATAAQATMKHRKPKSGPPVRSSELVSQLRAELEQVKAERENWWQQYNAMKCAGDSDLERENENLRSALRLRRDWLLAEAARAEERSKSYDASCGLPSAAMLRNQAQLIEGALAG